MIVIIAAVARNGVIGDNGRLPWSIPEDLRRFRRLTLHHPVIMGRKTFESIGKPLPQRTNIVLTSKADLAGSAVMTVGSLDEALAAARDEHGIASDVFIIGGERVYRDALPLARRMELTIVDAKPDGDAFFPPWNDAEWTTKSIEWHDGDPAYEFLTLRRARF